MGGLRLICFFQTLFYWFLFSFNGWIVICVRYFFVFLLPLLLLICLIVSAGLVSTGTPFLSLTLSKCDATPQYLMGPGTVSC